MDRIELGTADGTTENIERLAALFPQVITEVEDAQGKLEHAVDFDALRDLLGDVAEGARERYQFTWPGKREAKAEARRPIYKTMIPELGKSKDWDTTENLYIEGDNLDALKLLKETYAGKVKLIYIDPPYNTGHDFVYDDDFAKTRGEYDAESGDFDEEGGRLVANTEGNGRFHSDWCSMMYPRLLLARELLSQDGSMFVSISDVECGNLRHICDSVFGSYNFVTDIIWEKTDSPKMDSRLFSEKHDHILVYARQLEAFSINGLAVNEVPEHYNKTDENGRKYYLKPLRAMGVADSRDDRPSLYFGIEAPDGTLAYPLRTDGTDGRWRWSRDKVDNEHDNLEWTQSESRWTPYYRIYADESMTIPPETIWFNKEVGSNRTATSQLKKLLNGNKTFSTPKPVGLIKKIISLAVNNRELVVDFFSGSATTAEAVMRTNTEDRGHRQFIMVQFPELADEQGQFDTICDLGEERIRRAGEKIRAEIDEANKQLELGTDPKPYPDLGFRVLRIDSSNMKDSYLTPDETQQQSLFDYADNVKEGRTDFDLLFEVLPKFRIPYSAKIEERMLGGKKVFFVDGDRLAACFNANVGVETIEEMAKAKPWIAVMRDASMADDATQANFEELFHTYSPDTIARVI